MDGSTPLVPQYCASVQVQRKEIMAANQSSAPAPVAKPTMAMLLGPQNTNCECPFCNASIKTAVRYSTTSRTHIAAALWCLACCLCCVPYAALSSKNTDHYCPNCHRYLGTYEK